MASVDIRVRVRYETLVFLIARIMNYLKLWDSDYAKEWIGSFMEYNVGNTGWKQLPFEVVGWNCFDGGDNF